MNKIKLSYYCIDCGKEITYRTWKYGTGFCSSCTQKGKRNHMYGKKRPDVALKNRKIFKGKILSKNHKKVIALNHANVSGKKNPMYGKLAKHGKGQYYKGSYMRSSWEIAFAKYCIKNHIKYRYEPKTFEIIYKYKGKKKEGTYTPDFYMLQINKYIEIKGFWRDDAFEKVKAFRKLYPEIGFLVVGSKELKELKII